jgi:hypothetical protein
MHTYISRDGLYCNYSTFPFTSSDLYGGPYTSTLRNNRQVDNIIPESFTAAKVDKILSVYQLCQLFKNYRRFRDQVCPHHHVVLESAYGDSDCSPDVSKF